MNRLNCICKYSEIFEKNKILKDDLMILMMSRKDLLSCWFGTKIVITILRVFVSYYMFITPNNNISPIMQENNICECNRLYNIREKVVYLMLKQTNLNFLKGKWWITCNIFCTIHFQLLFVFLIMT